PIVPAIIFQWVSEDGMRTVRTIRRLRRRPRTLHRPDRPHIVPKIVPTQPLAAIRLIAVVGRWGRWFSVLGGLGGFDGRDVDYPSLAVPWGERDLDVNLAEVCGRAAQPPGQGARRARPVPAPAMALVDHRGQRGKQLRRGANPLGAGAVLHEG